MSKASELSVTTPELMERILSLGLSMTDLAVVFGVSKRTLERKVAENPDLQKAVHKGRIGRSISVRKTMYEMAVAGNTKALIFWLTHIDPVTDKSPKEDCMYDGEDLPATGFSPPNILNDEDIDFNCLKSFTFLWIEFIFICI
jgi:hypothetical protein